MGRYNGNPNIRKIGDCLFQKHMGSDPKSIEVNGRTVIDFNGLWDQSHRVLQAMGPDI